MDGTIVDTEPFWIRAETALVQRYGGTGSREQALTLVGRGLEDSAQVLQRHGVRMPVPEIIDTLTGDVVRDLADATPWRHGGRSPVPGVSETLTDDGVRDLADATPWRPGALELLAALRDAGVPTALV